MKTAMILVLLLCGAMAVGVLAASITARSEPTEPFTIRPGVTSIGDQGTYVTEMRYEDEWEIADPLRFAIEAEGTALDFRGARHETVTVLLERQLPDGNAWRDREVVSKHDRLLIQDQWDYESPDGLEFAQTTFERAIASLPALALQGTTLETDRSYRFPVAWETVEVVQGTGRGGGVVQGDLPEPYYVHAPVHPRSPSRPDLQAEAPQMATAHADRQGTLDGKDVVGLTYTTTEHHDRVVAVGPDASRAWPAYDVTTETTLWFADGIPYPVQVDQESRWVYEDAEVRETSARTRLTAFTPGEAPVAWGGTPDEPPRFDLHDAPDGYPVDGDTSVLPYPLSLALQDADEALDPEWRLWRQQRPEPDLIGATMAKGAQRSNGFETFEWRLFFQAGRDIVEVRTERGFGADHAVVEMMGENDAPHVPIGRAGPPLISFADAVHVWRETLGLDAEAVPDHLHWGQYVEEWGTSRTCLSGGGFGGSSRDAPDDVYQRVLVGASANGPCKTSDSVAHHEMVEILASGPALLGVHSTTMDWEAWDRFAWGGDEGETTIAAVAPREPVPAASFVTPSPAKAAAYSLPAALLMLGLYFLPAAKFAGTQGLLLVPAFSRLKKDRLLEQEHRDRLHTLVTENPGIAPSELVVQTDLSWSAVVHHLTILERSGLLASRVEGRHRRFFVSSDVPVAERDARAILANPHTHRFYEALTLDPGLATSELAERLGVSSPGALFHLQRLETNGLVERRRDGRYVRYYPVAAPVRPYDPNEAVEVA